MHATMRGNAGILAGLHSLKAPTFRTIIAALMLAALAACGGGGGGSGSGGIDSGGGGGGESGGSDGGGDGGSGSGGDGGSGSDGDGGDDGGSGAGGGDDGGGSGPPSAAENQAPTADAGADQSIAWPRASVQLSGTGMDDGLPDGSSLGYTWSGPSGVTFSDPSAPATGATFPGEGTYELILTVSDGALSATDMLRVVVSGTVYPAPDTNVDELHGWEKVDAADVGMDVAKLVQAQTYAESGEGEGGSGLIVRGGRLVHAWGDIDWKYDVKSTTKSIGGMMLGLALQDNLLAITDTARMRLPTLGDVPPGNNPVWLDQITILQLATHTAGFRKPAGDGVLDFEPGTTWVYSDAGLNGLADVLTQLYQEDLRELLFDHILVRIGLTKNDNDMVWRDHAFGDLQLGGVTRRELASGMQINTNGMARVGLLFLRGGMWDNNERLLPQSFIDLVSTPRPEIETTVNPEDGPDGRYPNATRNYGVLWWTNTTGELQGVPTDAYWSWGLGESLIVVIPSLDLVIARAGPQSVTVSPGRVWNDNDWDGRYEVLEGFVRPVVESVAP